MLLFDGGLRPKKQARLRIMVGEARRAEPCLRTFHHLRKRPETTRLLRARPGIFPGFGQAVGLVISASQRHARLHVPVALEIMERTAFRLVDRDLKEIGAAEARKLRVEVGKQPPLQQRILRDVDAGR